MRKLTLVLLWAFVFSLPSEFLVIGPLGTATRLLGVFAALAGLITIGSEGTIRRPGLIVALALGFILFSALSLAWTISPELANDRVLTYLQLFGLVWLVWEFVRQHEQGVAMMVAYCLGAYIPALDTIRAFIATDPVVDELRYASGAFDPNDLGLTLALAIPMGWYLFLTRRGLLRIAGVVYLPLAVVAILLTGSRGAVVATGVALCVIPLAFPLRSFRLSIVAIVALVASGVAMSVIPDAIWDRLSTMPGEITSGTVGGRWIIWNAGMRVFAESPFIGAGAGAFEKAVEPLIGEAASHNALIAILVEEGSVGLSIVVALVISLAAFIYVLRSPERQVWAVTGLTWFIGVMSLNWQYRKVTWFLIALLAAIAAAVRAREEAATAAPAGTLGQMPRPHAGGNERIPLVVGQPGFRY